VVYDAQISNQNAVTLNTSAYDAGVYVVKITTGKDVITKRLTVTK